MSKRTALWLPIFCLLTSCQFLVTTPFSRYLQSGTLAPDIRLKQGLLSILPGGSLEVGNTVVGVPREVTFTIENRGKADLELYGDPLVAIGGVDAEAFTVSSPPSTPIGAGGSSTLTLRFAPSSTGEKTATACIASSDPDTGVYLVTLTGTGTSTVPTLPYTELTYPSNWPDLQQYLDEQADLGNSGPPSASAGSIPLPSGGYKWVGGVLAPNAWT